MPPVKDTVDGSGPHIFWPCLLLIFAVGLAYSDVYANSFLLDDRALIVNNAFLRSWSYLGALLTTPARAGAAEAASLYRPLAMLAYFGVFQIGGLSTTCFHLLNVCLHMLNACLAYRLGCKLGFRPWASLMAALVWALHPLHVEAVAYMSGMPDLLYSLFCLLGVLTVLPDFTARKIWLSCGCFLLALLSKESAAIFPLLVMGCIFLRDPNRRTLRVYCKTWPLWLVACGYIVLRLTVLDSGVPIYAAHSEYADHILYRLFTSLATLPSYAALFVWPADLHMEREFPVYAGFFQGPVLLGAGMAALAALAVVRGRGRSALVMGWGVLWFAAANLPHTGIAFPLNERFFEHWMYLPTIGICLAMGESILTAAARLPGWTRARAEIALSLFLCLSFALGCRTWLQNKLWGDPIAFYQDILRHNKIWWVPNAENNLGGAYCERGDYADGIVHFRRAIEKAQALGQDVIPDPHNNLAVALMLQPDTALHTDEEIRELTRAIVIDPDYAQAYDSLSALYASLGEQEKANDYGAQADAIRRRNMHLKAQGAAR